MLVSARTNPPFQLMKNLFNLVFAFVLLTGITSLPASAQVPSSDDTLKVLKTYQRLTALVTDEMVGRHLPNLVNLEEVDDKGYSYKLGVTRARRIFIMALAVNESVGVIDTISPMNERGFLQTNAGDYGMYADYVRICKLKKRKVLVSVEDLTDPGKIWASMEVLNTIVGYAPYELIYIERVLRAWNGGPDGWRETGTKHEKPAHHERELQKTWKYYEQVMMYAQMCTFFEENGYAHIMWDWQGSPPSISAPPKL